MAILWIFATKRLLKTLFAPRGGPLVHEAGKISGKMIAVAVTAGFRDPVD